MMHQYRLRLAHEGGREIPSFVELRSSFVCRRASVATSVAILMV